MYRISLLSHIILPLLSFLSVIHALFQPFSLGNFNGTVLSDGVYTFCQNPYKVEDIILERVLKRRSNRIYPHTLSENVVVVDINGFRVMVDTGSMLPPEIPFPGSGDGGKLLTSMKEAGISPDSIDYVLLSHAHVDHVSGLVSRDNKPTFPNAVVYISKIDHEFWINPTNDTELFEVSLEGQQFTSQLYLRAISAYPNKIRLLNDLESPIPGITIQSAPGHSPGHSVYKFRKGNSRLTVTGDLWALRELQVRNPSIGFSFDTNSTEGAASRRKMLRTFMLRRDLVLAYHEKFPGLGYVRRRAKHNFDWVFANLNDLQPNQTETCPSSI